MILPDAKGLAFVAPHHVTPPVAEAGVDGLQGRAHAGRGLGRGNRREQKQACGKRSRTGHRTSLDEGLADPGQETCLQGHIIKAAGRGSEVPEVSREVNSWHPAPTSFLRELRQQNAGGESRGCGRNQDVAEQLPFSLSPFSDEIRLQTL